MEFRNKIIILGLLVVVLGVVAYIYFTYQAPPVSPSPPQSPSIAKFLPVISKLPSDQMPQNFPEGVFIENDALLLDNANISFPNGQFWSTRTYETQVGFEELQNDYKEYLKSLAGWTINDPHQRGEGNVFLVARNGSSSIVVHLQNRQDKNFVTITFVSRK